MYLGSNAYVCTYIEYMLDGGLPKALPRQSTLHTPPKPRAYKFDRGQTANPLFVLETVQGLGFWV